MLLWCTALPQAGQVLNGGGTWLFLLALKELFLFEVSSFHLLGSPGTLLGPARGGGNPGWAEPAQTGGCHLGGGLVAPILGSRGAHDSVLI